MTDAGASDNRLTLRRTYTVPKLVGCVVMLLLFFTPHISRAIYLSAMAESYHSVELVLEHANERTAANMGDMMSQMMAIQSRQWIEHFEQTHTRYPAAWVVIGGDKGWWFPVLAAIIVCYVVMRAVLTVRVMALEQAQSASDGGALYAWHRFAAFVFWLAVIAFVWSLADWLFNTPVWVPN